MSRLESLLNVHSIKLHLLEVEQLLFKAAMLLLDPQDLHPFTLDAAIAAQKCMRETSVTVICGAIRKAKELQACGLRMEDHHFVSHLKNGKIGRLSGTPFSMATLKMQDRNHQELMALDSARVTTRIISVKLNAHK